MASEQANRWGPFPIRDGLKRDRELWITTQDGEVVFTPGSIVTGMYRCTADVADQIVPSVQAAADAARRQPKQRES